MAKRILRFLIGAVVVLSVISFSSDSEAQGLNIFRASVDRISGNAGDSVTIGVRYDLSGSKPHNLRSLIARLIYDSSLIHVVSIETSGTATSLLYILDTISPSVIGFLAAGQSNQEIDLANPVLFRLKAVLNSKLSDTAWLRWDQSVAMFGDSSYGIDSIEEVDGWARTPQASGHVAVTIPRVIIYGQSDGYTADSVKTVVPVMLSDISRAGTQSARFSFSYDVQRLLFTGASTKESSDVGIGSLSSTSGNVDVNLLAKGQRIMGSDTVLWLSFTALVGTDTESTVFQSAHWIATNSSSLRGSIDYLIDSITLYGAFRKLSVNEFYGSGSFEVFPNPTSARFTIVPPDEAEYSVKIYDPLGAVCFESARLLKEIEIPRGTTAGLYRVVLRKRGSSFQIVRTLVVGP